MRIERFPSCRSTPNCVSSRDERQQWHVAPLRIGISADRVIPTLVRHLSRQRHVRIVRHDAISLHAEFATKWLRFIDDVHFLLDIDLHRLDIRSASRIGYYDFGTNRRRVERIRKDLQGALDGAESHSDSAE